RPRPDEASDSCQALRTLVRNIRAGDHFQRAIGVNGVTAQLRGIGVQLIEVRAGWADPVVAWTAAHRAVERAECPVARHLRARRVLRDVEDIAFDAVARDVAV